MKEKNQFLSAPDYSGQMGENWFLEEELNLEFFFRRPLGRGKAENKSVGKSVLK